MAVNIFDWSDKRAMLESLAQSIFRDRTFLVRDVGPKFPEYAKELAAVEADLMAVADKLYEIMMRSIGEKKAGACESVTVKDKGVKNETDNR